MDSREEEEEEEEGALERIHSKPDSRVNKETTFSKHSSSINILQRWTATTGTASALNRPSLGCGRVRIILHSPKSVYVVRTSGDSRTETGRREEKRGRASEQVSVGQSKEGEKRKKEKGG